MCREMRDHAQVEHSSLQNVFISWLTHSAIKSLLMLPTLGMRHEAVGSCLRHTVCHTKRPASSQVVMSVPAAGLITIHADERVRVRVLPGQCLKLWQIPSVSEWAEP